MTTFQSKTLGTVPPLVRTPPAVWTWSGDLDVADVPALRGALQALLDDHPTTLTIDLAAVTFLDCSGLSVLVRANNDPSTDLLLQSVPGCVRRLLQATGLDGVFALTEPSVAA